MSGNRSGRVFGDARVHAFAGHPPTALCGAGPLLTDTSDPEDDVEQCRMCLHLLPQSGPVVRRSRT